MNMFVKELTTGKGSAYTWNGAISHASTGSTLLDYFGKCGSYRGRPCEAVNSDMASIFGKEPEKAMKIVLYNGMITRKMKGFEETSTVQRGAGQRDEMIKSLAWIENNYPEILYKNLWLIPQISVWKNLWYDSVATNFHYYINTKEVYRLVKAGIRNEYHRALLAKYLPKIRSAKNCRTDRHKRLTAWARGLCSYLGWSEKEYRQFKSNPENNAHVYQRVMCAGDWQNLDFQMIPGKALLSFISSRGKDGKTILERHGLEDKYLSWIKSQPVAKFNGYPYELYKKASGNRNLAQKFTYDAQFEKLLETARDSVNPALLRKGVFCALDTSGSMSMGYGMGGTQDAGVAPIDVCVGLGIYFASLIEGAFHNNVIMFDSTSRIKTLSGTFCDKVDQIRSDSTAWGGTNAQSIVDEICRVRINNPDIPLEDYPEVLLMISDMQWNATGTFETNYEMYTRKLASVGLPPMNYIYWQVNGQNTEDFPGLSDDPKITFISGFDGAIVTTLLGGMDEVVDDKTGESRQLTAEERMDLALDQEILQKIKI